ncbi:MAG TPA: hypothetical protein VGV59_09515 [Pyrinomonadaceae bacterium]|nr:hypothetical protein [Pyrinomonadaceae bacterium]
MSWIKATDTTPPENEQVLIHDNVNSRMELGRYIKGKWYVEDTRTGQLRETDAVTHWGWLLDSQLHDDSDDD